MTKLFSLSVLTLLLNYFSLLNAQTALVMEASSFNIQSGSIFTMTVKIASVTDLHAYSIKVNYDTSLVQINSITKKDFFASHQTFFYAVFDSLNKIIRADEAILGTETQSGNGTLFEVTAYARMQGVADFSFNTTDLRTLDNNTIQHSTTGCSINISGTVDVDDELINQRAFRLLNNYPNPFNPSTTISFEVNEAMDINISVYNLNGELVENIFNDFCHAGNYKKVFNPHNLPSGFYVVRISGMNLTDTIKILLVK